MLCNYHTHTARCGHAQGTDREYIEAAIKRGIQVLGFSDHAPVSFPSGYVSGIRMKPEMTGEYFAALSALREEYEKDIDIKIGFELEYYPTVFESVLCELSHYAYDYLILGQHWCGDEEGPANIRPTDSEERLALYVEQVLIGLRTGRFSYLAHPDLIRYTGNDETYRRYMLLLCREAKAMDIPLECNIHGLVKNTHYPVERFFRIAGEVGNDVILGLDAHRPEEIFDLEPEREIRAFLKNLGITPVENVKLRDPRG